MNKFYFTFGCGQNPGIGYYTIIEAETESEAREKMYKLHGNQWSFCYKTAESAGVKRFGLQYVEPGFKFEEEEESK